MPQVLTITNMLKILAILLLPLLLATSAVADGGVDLAQQRIRIMLKSEPPTLNSLLATDNISGLVLTHLMEGLLQYNERSELAPGVAERWQLRADGATFWLRRDARWSDGKPVTAHDFVFAWQQVVAPATASRYAFIMAPIKNALRINGGELPPEALGVRAPDAYRLEVEFERPCPYFLGLTAFASYFPLREDFFRQRGAHYAADVEDLLFNGPFVLSRWQHGAHLTLTKNPQYWRREQIRLQEIDIPFVSGDATAGFNLFQERSIALTQLDAETLPDAIARGLSIKLFNTGAVYFLEFNFRAPHVTANLHLRRAIQAIFSPTQFVNKVVGLPGNLPGHSLFPRTVKGLHGLFRDEYPAPPVQRDLRRARAELALAKQELGVQQLPPLVLLAGVTPSSHKQAQYFQQLIQTGLGIDVRIDNQIFKQTLEKMNRGDFDIAMAGWSPDFDDAITFGDFMASWNENNRGRYNNPQYDEWVRIANASGEQAQRMTAFANMQRLLIDDVPLLPVYESAEMYAIDPRLHGVSRALFGGDIDFRHAYLEAAQ
jgi:oligopeptide transport system substrate-binding protein